MPEAKRPIRVFLCHASQDKPAVRELYQRLKKIDWIDPWLDKEELLLGQDFDLEIERAIESTDAVIAFISKNAVQKTGYVQKELKLIYNAAMYRPEGMPFAIPLRLEECDPPHRFKLWHWGDYFGNEKEKTYKSLLKSLEKIYEQSSPIDSDAKTDKELTEAIEQENIDSAQKDESPLVAKISKKLGRFDWGNKPLFILVGFIASLLAIITFTSGKQNIFEFFPTQPVPTLTSNVVFTLNSQPTFPSQISTLTFTSTPRFVEAPSATPTVVFPETGYSIVDRDEVFSLSPKVKALGELSREKYTPADRNAINRKLIYTINGTPDLPMFWRWYWCAATEEILKQNMEEIDIIFEADGDVITHEQLADTHYSNLNEETGETWWCFTYSTVIKDWKPGVYHLAQTTIIKSTIHDGKDIFQAGFKKSDFTIKIHSPGSKLEVLDVKGVPMVLVQGSKFKIGSNDSTDQQPIHAIYLNSFYIDKLEVSNALYKACEQAEICQPPQSTASHTHLSYYKDTKFDDYPVINVDWNMARTYCEWRGARLPTEAEWEIAARGVDSRLYAWGDAFDCTYANYFDSASQRCVGDTSPVNSYQQGISSFDVYGLTGNVWEWVNDWYSEDYYSISSEINPQGPAPEKYRVIRGGSWNDDSTKMKTTFRNWFDPEESSDSIGFRCANDATQ